ncbi:uncharacterized protein LOC115034699 [Acyrthosiphon pisum]|uniref:DUF4806 domain-containing protein n=1 Tax=Acyrthosiphon pisum TaxID=7029 RepID=A0A8R2JVY5_ACYPI|nr:uncharacterized protein LOC115034699 [Acyrthosiphon pisum]
MLNNIGHAVMDVSKELKTLKKEIHVIKVDVIKNQEILNSLAENDRRTVSSVDTRQAINRASLKIPVQTISELNEIEEDEDKLSTLVRILQRDARSFDAKRTTYMAMKLIMQNRVAEFLNMEGRRGEKTAFVKFKIYTCVIDCVKDIFPTVSLIEIEGHISDWLKQAPRWK